MENVKLPLSRRITLSSKNGMISVTLAGRSGEPSTILSVLLSSYVNCMECRTLFNMLRKALNFFVQHSIPDFFSVNVRCNVNLESWKSWSGFKIFFTNKKSESKKTRNVHANEKSGMCLNSQD